MINLDQVRPYWGAGIMGILKEEQEWRQAAGKKNPRKEGSNLLVHITEIELQ